MAMSIMILTSNWVGQVQKLLESHKDLNVLCLCRQPNGADLTVMQELLQLVEDEQIAAPSPIEQRWSAAR